VQDDYFPSIDGRSSTQADIASSGQESIGFIQVYLVKDSGCGWWEEEKDPGARGIEQLLADVNRLDQGLGTAMIRAFVEMLFEDPAVTTVQTDPDPENHRAIRCYTKAGFKPIRQVVTPEGLALLMRCNRSVDGGPRT
jgi:ribosomal protein S18 acetylase RimI-like enzyme